MAYNDDRTTVSWSYTSPAFPERLSLYGYPYLIDEGPTGADPNKDVASADTPPRMGSDGASTPPPSALGQGKQGTTPTGSTITMSYTVRMPPGLDFDANSGLIGGWLDEPSDE